MEQNENNAQGKTTLTKKWRFNCLVKRCAWLKVNRSEIGTFEKTQNAIIESLTII